VYVLVLAAGIVLTAAGIATLAAVRTQGRRSELESDQQRAAAAATSALELAIAKAQTDPTGSAWRVPSPRFDLAEVELADGVTIAPSILDAGGGNLSVSTGAAVYVLGDAVAGGARRRVRATMTPILTPLECLSTALWVNGNLTFDSASVFGSVPIGSNSKSSAVTSTVRPGVAAPSISGSTYTGGTRTLTRSLPMPGASFVTDWSGRAATIAFSATGGSLSKRVLTSGSNPFGSTNASGIYVIDCAGANITIGNIRVRGTLIILNAGSGSRIEKETLIESPSVNQPALIITGHMAFEMLGTDISEASLAYNFNPTGSPHNGVADSDTTDFYPSMIRGLVYVSGNVTTANANTIEGLMIVGGTMTIRNNLTLRYWPPESTLEGLRTTTGWTVSDISATQIIDP